MSPAAQIAPPAALPARPGPAERLRRRLRAARARRRGIQVGEGVALGSGVQFDVEGGASVDLHAGAVLGDGCRLHVSEGADVVIGAGAILGERCVLHARERIEIGERCMLADEVVLIDGEPRLEDVEKPVRQQGWRTSPVLVGARARVGPGAALLRGTAVAPGDVVEAHRTIGGGPR